MLVQLYFATLVLASSALGAVHQVIVGQNGTKTFTPSEVTAAEGDTVQFTFVAGNHTASQSTFANPCVNEGFTSGFVPGNATNSTSYSILVNNATKPIWVYCAQGNHCKDGQVMAINAPAQGNTFAAFLAAATGGGSGNATAAAGNGTNVTDGTNSTATGGNSTDSSSSASLFIPATTVLLGVGAVVLGTTI